MGLTRLTPLSDVKTHRQTGLCLACGKRISKDQDSVRLYGDRFHRDCAFHPPGREKGR